MELNKNKPTPEIGDDYDGQEEEGGSQDSLREESGDEEREESTGRDSGAERTLLLSPIIFLISIFLVTN